MRCERKKIALLESTSLKAMFSEDGQIKFLIESISELFNKNKYTIKHSLYGRNRCSKLQSCINSYDSHDNSII